MNQTKKLWIILGLVLAGAFTLLGVFGREIYRNAPPIPQRVKTETGRQLMTRDDILQGQRVWQSIGGHETSGPPRLACGFSRCTNQGFPGLLAPRRR